MKLMFTGLFVYAVLIAQYNFRHPRSNYVIMQPVTYSHYWRIIMAQLPPLPKSLKGTLGIEITNPSIDPSKSAIEIIEAMPIPKTGIALPENEMLLNILPSEFDPSQYDDKAIALLNHWTPIILGRKSYVIGDRLGHVVNTPEQVLEHAVKHARIEAAMAAEALEKSRMYDMTDGQRKREERRKLVNKEQEARKQKYQDFIKECAARKAAIELAKTEWRIAVANRDKVFMELNEDVEAKRKHMQMLRDTPSPVYVPD